jgi:hypothetical protein
LTASGGFHEIVSQATFIVGECSGGQFERGLSRRGTIKSSADCQTARPS